MADGDAPDSLSESLLLLGAVLLDEHSLEDLLAHVLRIVARTMPSVSAGSISLVRGGRVFTSNASGADATSADDAQYRSGLGPNLIAIETGEQVRVEIEAEWDRWPEFAAAAVEAGFLSSLSTPLRVRDQSIGGLNLYGRDANGFGGQEPQLADLFAQHASVVVSNALAFTSVNETSEHLKEALASREVIGVATGLIMGQQGLTREQAFDVLRRVSQRENRKVRELASELIERAEQRLGQGL